MHEAAKVEAARHGAGQGTPDTVSARAAEGLVAVLEVAAREASLTRTLVTLARVAAQTCDADRCSIWLEEDDGALVPVMSQYADGRDDRKMWAMFLETTAAAPFLHEAIRRGSAVACDRTPDDHFTAEWADPFGIRSAVCVPLNAAGSIVGAFVVDRTTVRPFTPAECRLVEAFSVQAALILESARHLDRQRRSRRAAEALGRAAMSLGKHLEESDVLQTLVTEARGALETEVTLLFQLEPHAETVCRVFSSTAAEVDAAATPAGLDWSGDALRRELVAVRELLVAGAGEDSGAELAGLLGLRSCIAVPVGSRGKLEGVLVCGEMASCRRYEPEERELARALAAHAGAAIDNALLYRRAVDASRRDPLTEIGNRRAFEEELERELGRARRYAHPLSVVLVDVDNLKEINDGWGHHGGDGVLRQLAGILAAGLRESDRAFRIGGDEFALVLPETSAAQAAVLADRLRLASARASFGVPGLRVSISAGISSFPAHADATEALVRLADAALYETKDGGRNAVAVSRTVTGDAASGERFGVDLARVIAEGSLVAAYQPIFELPTLRVAGYEACCRLDPSAGDVPTTMLFRAADVLGLSAELEQLCCSIAADGARGLPMDADLFLNVSPAALESPAFALEDLVASLERAGIGPGRTVLEVTEQHRVPGSGALAQSLRACREAGFRIAIDDLGAGPADLELLSGFDFDYAKIDMVYVQGASTSPARRRLLGGLRLLAAEAGARVVAEGVETREDLATVAGLGFWAAQGYALGRPSPQIAPSADCDARVQPRVGVAAVES